MLTIEYRVNGQLIGYTNIHNTGWFPEPEGGCSYEYTHFGKKKKCGEVIHDRSDGFEVLVGKVLKKITK